MFYNYSKIQSYNALLNFIIGGRGIGKSYGAKKMVIQDFLKNGNQFVYLRRYKTELDTSVPTFFDDIKANDEFGDDVVMTVKKNKKLVTFEINGETAGYAIALSTSNILKSTSFPKVKTIIYDEFIIDKGVYHYLKDEPIKFLDAVETIGRLRDVRCYLLGNAVSIINPFFSYWNLSTPYGSEFKRFKDGLIVVNCPINPEYEKAKKESRFGRLIEGTDYGDYAIENKWLRDSNSFIEKKSASAKYFATIVINGMNLGIWRDYEEGVIYLSDHYNPNCNIKIACTAEDHQENTILASLSSNPILKLIVLGFKNGNLRFSSMKVKGVAMKLLTKYLV